MNIIAVVNQKGGVAKTTTLGLGCEAPDAEYGLPEALLSPDSFPPAALIQQVGSDPLFMLPGHMEMGDADALLMRTRDSGLHLKKALESVLEERQYDWILIDCPPSLGALTQNALAASSHLLVPTEPRVYSFAGMDTLDRLLARTSERYGVKPELLGVLLTMVESTRLHRTISAVIRERFGEKVFETEIRRNVRISEAELEGQSVLHFDRRAAGARSYQALAAEVIQRAAEGSPAKRRAA
jgi:chromosome partitioning protein